MTFKQKCDYAASVLLRCTLGLIVFILAFVAFCAGAWFIDLVGAKAIVFLIFLVVICGASYGVGCSIWPIKPKDKS